MSFQVKKIISRKFDSIKFLANGKMEVSFIFSIFPQTWLKIVPQEIDFQRSIIIKLTKLLPEIGFRKIQN